jgi:hypothetical protein
MASGAFSADVRLSLRLDGRDLSVAQVGPNFCIVAESCDRIAPQEALLIVQIDEHRTETPIRMLNPIDGEYCRVQYERIGSDCKSVTPNRN